LARQMQEEMIREIELARPKYLIFVGMSTSWLRLPESEQLIFTWANEYIRRDYTIVGAVNITTSDSSDPYSVDRPKSVPHPANYVAIYKRKNDLSALRSQGAFNLRIDQPRFIINHLSPLTIPIPLQAVEQSLLSPEDRHSTSRASTPPPGDRRARA